MISRRRLPTRDALERARLLLQEAVVRDPGGRLGRGLTRFGSWRSLAAVIDTDWLPLPRRSSVAMRRVVRQRLRALGNDPLPFDATTALPGGEPVQLQGTCAPLSGDGPEATLWRAEVVDEAGELWAVDEGSDFLLRAADGTRALIAAEAGRLVNADRLHAGDQVAVFGLGDQAPDRAGLAPSPHGRGGLGPAVRSGPRHPLLVSVIRRYDQEDDAPQD